MLALVAGAGIAGAQKGLVTVQAAKNGLISVAPGGAVTAAFTAKNATRDSLLIQPVVTLPTGWRTAMAPAAAMLGPVSSDLWLISVVAPASAPAGRYVIHLRLGVNAPSVAAGDVWGVGMARDSVVITVAETRAIFMHTAVAPTYVMSGDSYTATFIVRNRGNVASRIALRATSNHGSVPRLSAAKLELFAGQGDTISATVAIAADLRRSVQEVLEIFAVDMNADTVRAESSVEMTIVPNATAGPEFWTVPGQFAFRAAGSGTGVSPVVAWGSGRISEKSDVAMDFSIHTAPRVVSVFGERDEYRIGLRNSHGGIRAGDDSYGFSLLTSTGGQGTGAEVRGLSDRLVGGAYVQRNRWNPGTATEAAAMIGTSPARNSSASMVLLERGKSGTNSRVLAATAQTSVKGSHLELEAATSDSQRVGGGAAIVRFFGDAPTFAYDIGAQRASVDFAGAQHATADQHVTLSGQQVGPVLLSAMTSIHTTTPTARSAGFGQRIATSSVTANFTNGAAVEFERYDRADRGTATLFRGTQQSLRVRGHYALGRVDFGANLQGGIVAQADSASSHGFTTLSGTARVLVGRDQYVSVFSDMSDGRTLGAGGAGTLTGGGNTELRLGHETTLRLTASVTAQRDRLAAWIGQSDITVEHTVRQSVVALRARIAQSGAGAVPASNAVYLEVRTPLHVPTARLNLGGRARARVIDAETGKGVVGALVRIGEHAAITDKDGAANFRGLALGEYRAMVDGGAAAGRLVTGSNVVDVATNSRTPVAFTLSLARGAQLVAHLRRFEKNVGTGPGAPDSLIDAGGIDQAVVALISGRDTIWQSSDDRGRVDFGSVAPGRYKLVIAACDVPEFMAFEHKEITIDVVSGEKRGVELRMVPQSRPVEFVGEETVLVAAPAVAAQPIAAESKVRPEPTKPLPTTTPSRSQRSNQSRND